MEGRGGRRMHDIARNLKRLRRQRGLTQEELAARLQYDQARRDAEDLEERIRDLLQEREELRAIRRIYMDMEGVMEDGFQ